MNITCPLCRTAPMELPHHVCAACCEKYRQEIVHTRKQVERGIRRRAKLADDAPLTPPLEHSIQVHMREQTRRWEHLTQTGLHASRVAADAIDEDDELPKRKNHHRRIAFMKDLVTVLSDTYFAPATRHQLNVAMDTATAYWNDDASDEDRKCAHDELRSLLGKERPYDWDLHSLPLWMLQTEPFFSWMWYQWFDCVWCCIPDDMPDDVDLMFTELLQQHFPAEIQAWFK